MKINNILQELCYALGFILCFQLASATPLESSEKSLEQPILLNETPKKKIEDYNFETLMNTTPLQFSMNSIRYYLDSTRSLTRDLQVVNKKPEASPDETFTRGFSQYVSDVYNRHNYATMLSQDGTHLVDFLQLSEELNLNQTTLYVGLRLFHNKLKSCEIIDDAAILQMIEPIGKYLEKHFEETEPLYRTNLSLMRKHTEELMLAKFTDHYTTFQTQPDSFLLSLSEEITKEFKQEFVNFEKNMKEQQQKAESRERLRNLTMRFLETALSKTMWSTQSHEGIWQSFQAIAFDLQSLGVRSVVNHMDDMDSLLWSHIHRFCYFIDLVGSHLPLEFYEEVETDLSSKMVYFLEEKEQDACIKTKKETLEEALIKGRMKSTAMHRGIVDNFVA